VSSCKWNSGKNSNQERVKPTVGHSFKHRGWSFQGRGIIRKVKNVAGGRGAVPEKQGRGKNDRTTKREDLHSSFFEKRNQHPHQWVKRGRALSGIKKKRSCTNGVTNQWGKYWRRHGLIEERYESDATTASEERKRRKERSIAFDST